MTNQTERRGQTGLAAFFIPARASFKTALLRACALAAALAGAMVSAALADGCQPDRVDLRGDWGQARFQIELADEPAERQRGLMFRQEMSAGAGMLFAYDREQPVAFWMRNTYLALDLIFADGRGVVRHVHHNAVPLDETLIHGGTHIQYVLEVNAGLAAKLGLMPGSQLRHPVIADAAWGCDTGISAD